MTFPRLSFILGSAALPLLAGAAPQEAMSIMPDGAPWWLPYLLAVVTPGCTWAIGSVGAIAARMAVAWLRSSAKAARDAAALTPGKEDDAQADAIGAAKEAAADEIEKRAKLLVPGKE
jgi:hypothetical protein